MTTILAELTSLLVSPAGTFAFYLVAVFSVFMGIQQLLPALTKPWPRLARQLFAGFSLLLFALLVIFAMNLLAWQQWINARLWMPLLEKAFLFFSIAAFSYLWVFPQKNRILMALAGILLLLVPVGFYLSLIGWNIQYEAFYFNRTNIDWYWNLAILVISAISIVYLLIYRPDQWGNGLVALLAPSAAILLSMFIFHVDGDFSGLIRLGMLVSFPMLQGLTHRLYQSQPTRRTDTTPTAMLDSFNKNLRIVTESDLSIFQDNIPRMIAQLSQAANCWVIRSSNRSPKLFIEEALNERSDQQIRQPNTIELEPEDYPTLSHAIESQFLLSFDNIPDFRDEFRRLGKVVNHFGSLSVLVLPYPISPESKNSLILSSKNRNQWNDVEKAEIASAVNFLLLILHQKQRENQLQKSIQRLTESTQPDFRSVSSFNYQDLQDQHNQLTQEHEVLQGRYRRLQNDLARLAEQLGSQNNVLTNEQTELSVSTLRSWLDQAQSQNGLLQAQMDQLVREKQSLELEIDHYRDIKQLADQYSYLQPQESQPLDEKTNLNETLARAHELLFKITEMNNILEQNQVQSVIVLESIQERVNNLHHTRGNEQEADEGSFLTQAEYFLEDIRTAQSILKEQSRLQKMLEETFLNSLKMKDHFDHLAQINHRNYRKINQIYKELESNRTLTQETTLILSSIQEENEKLRLSMMDAMAKNQGDSVTIENLQTEMLSAMEEINILKDKIEQKQDMLYALQNQNDLTREGVKENNQIISSLLQDILQPISTIQGCTNLLSNHMPEDEIVAKLNHQMQSSLRAIQEQVNKLILCTERNAMLLSRQMDPLPERKTRPTTPPEVIKRDEQ